MKTSRRRMRIHDTQLRFPLFVFALLSSTIMGIGNTTANFNKSFLLFNTWQLSHMHTWAKLDLKQNEKIMFEEGVRPC